MITKLEIENFKAFRGKHEIPIAPITLIYGPNSGGKSSVIQSLLLLKQSMDAGRFLARGPLVDLGSFHSCVWKHDVEKPLRLAVTVSGVHRRGGDDDLAGATWELGPELSVWLTFRSLKVGPSEPTRVRLSACRYKALTNGEEAFDVRLQYDAHLSEVLTNDLRFKFSGERSQRWLKQRLQAMELSDAASELPLYGAFTQRSLMPHHVLQSDAVEQLAAQFFPSENWPERPRWPHQPLSLYKDQLESVLDSIRYIGPLRARPTRAYGTLDNGADWVGSAGEYASQALLQGRARKHASSKELSSVFDEWIRKLDIPYRFDVRSVGDHVLGDGIRTTLVDQRFKVSVGLTDVGSGVGQVLPLLVQAAFGGAQVMCVEQPELHLHPRAQSALGDVLLESAGLCGNRSRASATQWLVETHSETLLLRIKRRIREGLVDPSDVCVLYVNPGRSGSVVTRLRMDERGDFIDEWPSGFFEDAFNEVFS